MAIEVGCTCGQRFRAQPHLAGKQLRCPSCGSPLAIPVPPRPTTAASPQVVACLCGQRFRAEPHLAGTQVQCPMCNRPLHIPCGSIAASATQATASHTASAVDDLWGDLPKPPSQFAGVALSPAHANHANQILFSARTEVTKKNKDLDAWATGKIVSGIAMIAGSILWFALGLLAGWIYLYPPIMFVTGVIALINGLSQKFSR